MPAEEHDDASADDVEPGLVLPRNLAESPASRAPLLLHHLYPPPSVYEVTERGGVTETILLVLGWGS